MLSAWNAAERRLAPVVADALAGARWVHVVAPSSSEQEAVLGLGVPAELLQHALDANEVARVDHVDGASLVVLRVPWVEPRPEEPYRTAAFGIIVAGDHLVTVVPVEDDLLPHLGVPELDGGDATRFLLRVLERVAAAYLTDLRAIDRAVDEVETRLQDSQENAEVKALLRYQKGLAHFETALRSNQIMLERLRRDARFKRTPEDDELFDDVEVELRQAAEMTGISTNILSSTMDAFASIIWASRPTSCRRRWTPSPRSSPTT
jgi:magnesium transporter